jgi:hypothetical protein
MLLNEVQHQDAQLAALKEELTTKTEELRSPKKQD